MSPRSLIALLGPRRWSMSLIAGFGIAVSATWIAQAVVTVQIFDLLLDPAYRERRLTGMASWIAILAAILMARPLLVMAREVLAATLMDRIKQDLRQKLATGIVRRQIRDGAHSRTGHDSAVLADGIENLDPYLSRYVPQLAVTMLVSTVVAIVMLVIDPVTGAIAGTAAVALPLLPRLWDRALSRRGADHWAAYQDMHADFVDSMQGMTTLVLFGAAERRQHQLAASSRRLLQRTLRQLKLSLIESGLNTFALAAIPLAALITVWLRAGQLDTPQSFALVLLSIELVRPLRDLASMWHAGYLGTFSGAQIVTVLNDTELEPGHAVRPATSWGMRGVHYAHSSAGEPVLTGVDLEIHAGITGIVGPSGGGKSTLVGILAGLHRPDHGYVYGPGDPLQLVSLIPQDPVLFSGSVAENIALGAAGTAAIGVTDAARVAGIGTDDPTITLESDVGERGSLVSGGQRQRIAIARALVQGRQMLILDESTSALDARSEQLVLERIRALNQDRPVIVVAHRPGALHRADRIITVDRHVVRG